MFKRPTSGSIVCPNCGRLVGVRDEKCLGCGRANPGLWGFTPLLNSLGRNLGFEDVVLWGCGLLYVVTLLWDPKAAFSFGGGFLSILSPAHEPLFLFGSTGAAPIFGYGRWWTVLSAAWLHGGILHIGFNLWWIRQLVPMVSEVFGLGRLLIIYTVSAVLGSLMTSVIALLVALGPLAFLPGFLNGAAYSIGASTSLCGLFGAMLVYGQRTGNSNMVRQIRGFVIYILIFGLIFPGIDNWGHIGGFIGGWAAARLLDPLRQETPTHLVIGLGCLLAMFLAIVASFIHGLPIVRAAMG